MDTSRCKVWRRRLPDPVGHMNSSDRQEYVVVRAGQSDVCVTLHTWIGEMQEMQEWERHSRIQLCRWDWVQRSLLVILRAEIRCGAMPPPPPPPPPLPSPPSFSPSAFLDSNKSVGFVWIIPSMSDSCLVVTPPKEVRRSPASLLLHPLLALGPLTFPIAATCLSWATEAYTTSSKAFLSSYLHWLSSVSWKCPHPTSTAPSRLLGGLLSNTVNGTRSCNWEAVPCETLASLHSSRLLRIPCMHARTAEQACLEWTQCECQAHSNTAGKPLVCTRCPLVSQLMHREVNTLSCLLIGRAMCTTRSLCALR